MEPNENRVQFTRSSVHPMMAFLRTIISELRWSNSLAFPLWKLWQKFHSPQRKREN